MLLNQLQNEILPTAFTNNDCTFISCEFDKEAVGEDQYASNVVFVKVVMEKKNERITVPVVVKVEPFNPRMRKLVNTNIQFYNEVFMYSKILPLLEQGLKKTFIFPHFHFGIGLLNESEKNVIILQDLRHLGFRLTESKACLDLDHLSLAMSKLGQFHALSYVTKNKSHTEFFKLASCLEDNFCRKGHGVHRMAQASLHRAVDPLLKENKYVRVLQRFIKKVDNDFHSFLLELVSPTDPLAVICHGDFCRNNILFKYNNTKPIDVRFFDIATARCASPAIDISFLLFLNSSQEIRRRHWDTLLKIYHKGLSSILYDINVPSLEDIKEAVRRKALWGLVHCSFFLPLVMYGGPANFEEMSEEEIIATNLSRGGDEGTKVLNELVEEMVERRMFED